MGIYHSGFMFWAGTAFSSLVHPPSEFVLVGVVEKVEPPNDTTESYADNYWSGYLRVTEVLVCPPELLHDAEKIRLLESDGFDGLVRGDTVIVFMARYEGSYGIPARDGTNCLLGYRYPRNNKESCYHEVRLLVEMLRKGKAWEIGSLTPDELHVWECIDPMGIAQVLEYQNQFPSK